MEISFFSSLFSFTQTLRGAREFFEFYMYKYFVSLILTHFYQKNNEMTILYVKLKVLT